MNEEESIINYFKYGTHHPLNDIYNFAPRGLLHYIRSNQLSKVTRKIFSNCWQLHLKVRTTRDWVGRKRNLEGVCGTTERVRRTNRLWGKLGSWLKSLFIESLTRKLTVSNDPKFDSDTVLNFTVFCSNIKQPPWWDFKCRANFLCKVHSMKKENINFSVNFGLVEWD